MKLTRVIPRLSI